MQTHDPSQVAAAARISNSDCCWWEGVHVLQALHEEYIQRLLRFRCDSNQAANVAAQWVDTDWKDWLHICCVQGQARLLWWSRTKSFLMTFPHFTQRPSNTSKLLLRWAIFSKRVSLSITHWWEYYNCRRTLREVIMLQHLCIWLEKDEMEQNRPRNWRANIQDNHALRFPLFLWLHDQQGRRRVRGHQHKELASAKSQSIWEYSFRHLSVCKMHRHWSHAHIDLWWDRLSKIKAIPFMNKSSVKISQEVIQSFIYQNINNFFLFIFLFFPFFPFNIFPHSINLIELKHVQR